MVMDAGRWKKRRTKDKASFPYTKENVFLLHRISHWDLHIPLKQLAQSKPVIIVTLDSEVQNPAHAKALKFPKMLFRRRGCGEVWTGSTWTWRKRGPRGGRHIGRGRRDKELSVPCRAG